MDWTAKEAITKQIDEMPEKQTFSASAIEGIKKLRDRVAELEKDNGKLLENINAKTVKITELEANLTTAREANAAWSAREAALARMPWGKIKIIGEDTYSYDATALLKRLHGRRLAADGV